MIFVGSLLVRWLRCGFVIIIIIIMSTVASVALGSRGCHFLIALAFPSSLHPAMPPATKKSKKDSFPAAGGVHPIHAAPEAPQVEQPAPALEDDGLAQADQEAPSEGASASAMLPAVGGGLNESQLSAEGMGETPQPKTAAAELAELGRPEPAPKKARTEAVVPPRPAVGGSAPLVPTPCFSVALRTPNLYACL